MGIKMSDCSLKLQERIVRDNQQAFGLAKVICDAKGVLQKAFPSVPVTIAGDKNRLRQDSKPLLNKLETKFWRVLCERFGDSQVKPQALRFKLGNGIFYKPDFVVTEPTRGIVACYEVKGPHVFRGGFENLKVAAHQWPHVKWRLVWLDEKYSQWHEQEILP